MKRLTLLLLGITLLILTWTQGVFAFDITCPAPDPKTEKELTPEYIWGKIDSCIKARAEGREAALSESEDFYCPSGKFTLPDSRPLTDETIAYHVSVSIFFSEIDKEVMQYICKLRETREKNIIITSNDIRVTLEWTATNIWFLQKYDQVCGFPYIQSHINTNEKQWILTTETYPQTICKNIATSKKYAWKNLAYILVSDGMAKSYQNDKDTFIDKVKTKYDGVREKFHSLLQLLDKAIKNMTNYTKSSVKWG